MDKVNEVINAIRSYTNRAFIKSYVYGEFDTQTMDIPKGIFEIKGSQYNDGFHYGGDKLVGEVFEGYVINIHVPVSKDTLISMGENIVQLTSKGNVRREQVGDSSYTLDTGTSIGGVPLGLLQSLSHYRVLPGGVEKEYQDVGII